MNDEPRMMNSDGRTFREFGLRGDKQPNDEQSE